jgi:hypothetical protein
VVFGTLLRWGVGFASTTLPPEEEEPRVTTYAAAEKVELKGSDSQTEKTTMELLEVSSTGGGRVLRICLCLQEDAVWKRRQNDVEAVLSKAFG